MTTVKPKPVAHSAASDSAKAVTDFMLLLDHPFKQEIEAIRKIVLGAHATIAEGIKWNAPSFRTSEYFATTNLRAKDGIGLIFHLGAKVRGMPPGGMQIEDPEKLLKWLAKDRATAAFIDMNDVRAKKVALEGIVRQWITHV